MSVAMSSYSFTIFVYILLPALHLAWGNKPEIRAFPSKVVKKGDNVTMRCSFPHYQGGFRLQRTSSDYSDSKYSNVSEYNFTVMDIQEDKSTNYRCIQLSGENWSEPSDSLTLKVIDAQKPIISCVQEDLQLLITCRAPDPPEECRVKRFHLYSGKVLLRDFAVQDGPPQMTFKVSNPSKEYRCSYVLEVKEEPSQLIEAPFSDEVTPTKWNVPQHGGGEGCSGESRCGIHCEEDPERGGGIADKDEGKGVDDGILIPAVATTCGILTLILIVILVVYFTRKNKLSTRKTKNGDFDQSEKAETATEATYCTVEENRVRATPDVEIDMRDTRLDDHNNDGITYAILNDAALREKNTQSEVPAPTDTSLYAEVKKSRPK